VNLIADMEDAEGASSEPNLRLVRVDVHGTQARYFLLPGLPRFRHNIRHPAALQRSAPTAGHDPRRLRCILRAGELSDSPLISADWRCSTGDLRQPGLSRASARRRRPTISQVTRWSDCYRRQRDIVPLIFGAAATRAR